VELGGWVVRRLIEEGILDARQCVFHNAGVTEIEELFKKLHTMLAGRKGYLVPELANVAHRVRGIAKRGRKPTQKLRPRAPRGGVRLQLAESNSTAGREGERGIIFRGVLGK
jgi:hypothetical protein